MREIFAFIATEVSNKWGEDIDVKYPAVTGFIFLRFFCPAILNPHLYGLVTDHPSEIASRNFTLISKTLMNLANLVGFGQKRTLHDRCEYFY